MNSVWYKNADVHIQDGTWQGWDTETLVAILIKGSTTTPDDPDHEFIDDISADESAATGYTRVTLTGVAHSPDGTDPISRVIHDLIDWSGITPGAEVYEGVIVACERTTDADSFLIFGISLPNIASALSVRHASDGAVEMGAGTLS